MGYRSDVRIITSKKGFNRLKRYVNKCLKEKNIKENWLFNNFDVFEQNDYSCYFGWNYVKWYEFSEGFEDVSSIVEGLNDLEENNYSFRYARIGEDYDDYEEKWYESTRESEQDLEYPNLIRAFDDNYVIDNMKGVRL